MNGISMIIIKGLSAFGRPAYAADPAAVKARVNNAEFRFIPGSPDEVEKPGDLEQAARLIKAYNIPIEVTVYYGGGKTTKDILYYWAKTVTVGERMAFIEDKLAGARYRINDRLTTDRALAGTVHIRVLGDKEDREILARIKPAAPAMESPEVKPKGDLLAAIKDVEPAKPAGNLLAEARNIKSDDPNLKGVK